MRTCYPFALAGALTLFSTVSAVADSTDCTSLGARNLVQNCGFELGTYIDSNGVAVPTDWISNAAFDSGAAFNNLRTLPNNGTYSLEIGNLDSQSLAALSQTLNDVVGATYSGSLFVDYGGCCDDQIGVFDLRVGNQVALSLGPSTADAFLQYSFSFTGTGHDLLTIEGATFQSYWFVDDVVVTGALVTPEPKPGYLGAASLLGILLLKRRVKAR